MPTNDDDFNTDRVLTELRAAILGVLGVLTIIFVAIGMIMVLLKR